MTDRAARGNRLRAGTWLCLAGAALGALGLLGWISGLTVLTTAVHGLPPMMPTTALALLLIGGAGAAHQRSDWGAFSKIGFGLAAVVVLAVGLGTLAEYGLGKELPIDQVLPPGQSTLLSGRPSPLTALALTCLAAALLFSNARAGVRLYPSEWLALCAALVALTGLTGIILGAAPLYRLTRSPIIGLSLPTSVSLLLTSMGVLFARPTTGFMHVVTSPGPGGMLLRRVALPTIVVPILVSLVVTRFSAAQGIADARIPVAILVVMMTVVSLSLFVVAAVPLNRAHHDVEASRSQIRNLVEQAPDGIFVANTDGRYTDVNDAGCRLLQFSREEIVGRTIVDLLPRDDIERLWQSRELLLQGAVEVGEWRLRRKDGSFVPVEVSARILPDGRWQGFVRDITERKRIESEQRFQVELDSALAATLDYQETLSRIADVATRGLADFCVIDLLDDEGKVQRLRVVSQDASKAWICDALQGIPFDRGRPSLILSALESRQPVLVPRLSAADLEALSQNDDQLRTLRAAELQSVMVIPLVVVGRLLGAVSFLSTVASRVYGPDELRMAGDLAQRAALAVDNARLYREAQRAIQARDDVLGIVAHDLRNPLSMILLEAQFLRGDAPGPRRESRESGEAISRAATRMNRLIQDLLDVTCMEAGQLAIHRVRLSGAQIAADAIDSHRAQAASRSIDLRLAAQEVPEVWADRERILQVFGNLIGNSLKCTAPGGCITVGMAARDAAVLFWVADTGSGIALEDQPHIFDRFWQGRVTQRTGAGLGLAIVKNIVEAHGGSVRVDSVPGRGSTFFFTIPTAPAVTAATDHATVLS